MHILNNTMSYYTCTKCSKVKIARAADSELDLVCCDGPEKLVKHKLGKLAKTPTVKPTVAAPAVEVKKPAGLDLPPSGVKPLETKK